MGVSAQALFAPLLASFVTGDRGAASISPTSHTADRQTVQKHLELLINPIQNN